MRWCSARHFLQRRKQKYLEEKSAGAFENSPDHCPSRLLHSIHPKTTPTPSRRRRSAGAIIDRRSEVLSGGGGREMSAYLWKSFSEEDDDRPEKPRRFGLTEMRGPAYSLLSQNALQDIFESYGQFVDGLKFSGGSHSLMPKDFVKEITDMAHKHNIYVSTGDWAEHLLRKGHASFMQHVEECKRLGFDTIELDVSSLKVPEEVLLRYIRLIKSAGLKAKPQLAVKVESSEIPAPGIRAFGAYQPPVARKSELVEDVDLLIRRAERFLEAGADMIMIDAEGVCKYAESLRTDIVAKIVGRLGLEKAMFEASHPSTSEWFVKQYGPRVNLFVDHSQVMNLECLRGHRLGVKGSSRFSSTYF